MGIKIKNLDVKLTESKNRILQNAINDVSVVQLSQVKNAFQNGGQPGEKWPVMWADSFNGGKTKRGKDIQSHRKGGQRLRDTGALSQSFFLKHKAVARNIAKSVIASSLFYAIYQQEGLKTKGPNFIPLTVRARTIHQLHANPKNEGLKNGVDYIIAWNGVNVPPSPMIDYSDAANLKEMNAIIKKSIKQG